MDKKLEFELKIIRIHRIYIASKENSNYSQYLLTWNNECEKEYITKSSHLRYISHSLWRISIIEACKLVVKSRNNHFNLFHLIDFIEKNLLSYVTLNDIEKWHKTLMNAQKEISLLQQIRDKIYAHTDESTPLIQHIDRETLNSVLDATWVVIFEMASKISGAHLSSGLPFFEGQILNIVEVLANERDNWIKKKYQK